MRFIFVFAFTISMCVVLVACNQPQPEKKKEASVIIFRGADGKTITMEDIRGLTGEYKYENIGSSDIPAEAQLLHQQARQAGGKGDYKKAIALLDRASGFSPQWPYPLYDKAYTLLLMKDYDSAREYYRKTIMLSPRGFFTAITALDTLEREKKGPCLPEPILRTCAWNGSKTKSKKPEQCVKWLISFLSLRQGGGNLPFSLMTMAKCLQLLKKD